MEVNQASKDLLRVELCLALRELLRGLIVGHDASSGKVFKVNAELAAYNFAADVLDDAFMA